ncbi:SubName: Full=Uncharacterized protein {ECO:0000313/EMBL:CCA77964.1} [Serendipita indica DSM 11827]|uniref:Uncharacterized protein n=1 Tax=Serendipita indica (strain DSM 11827) TaxID=1109443 RepID=G4U2W8_SERID|nr:SubName: Full=Uncharacterized protein {ECO:0000313/EMBL:CCA77964.1} [Serendipita indica DSM 11827]CCA77964.1 hypothetical protein PIIN_00678 [Serendipita indica DSM 11827]
MSSPSATPSPTSPSASNDENGSILSITALVVALVALVVSMLQLILQYVLSAEGRSKCSTAAIGAWADKNTQFWRPWKGKIYIKYAQLDITTQRFLDALGSQGLEREAHLAVLKNYQVTEQTPVFETKHGKMVGGPPQLILARKGTEEIEPTLPNTLRGAERVAADALVAEKKRLYSPTPPTKATWCALLCDLGLDLQKLSGTGEFIEADTIPSVLDAPPIHMRMSDLIHFGLLLEMKIVEADELKRILNMTGRYCSLVSKHQDGVGMLCRYTGNLIGTQPAVKRISTQEARMLCETADGMIYIGDCMMPITSFGFNSLDAIFKHVIRECKQNAWQEVDLKDLPRSTERDGLGYGGKWANSPTPITGLLMAIAGNVGVGNSFPHETIKAWTDPMRREAVVNAFQTLQGQPGFTVAPRDIFQRICESGTDLMVMDEFRTVNNYGCQFGGIRGWLSTNMAAFTLKMSSLWIYEPRYDHQRFEPVPLLHQLFPVLQAGSLCKTWGENYSFNPEEGNGWRLPVSSLLWLQISLLDTWLARHVDMIIQETAMPEVSVPAGLESAKLCAKSASEVLTQSTAWNPPRLRFCRMYLARLAGDVHGRGVSFMSNAPAYVDRKEGWKNMPIGSPDEWLMADAVLTLRAALQHTRFMLMMDSSALLRLQKFDPSLLLA